MRDPKIVNETARLPAHTQLATAKEEKIDNYAVVTRLRIVIKGATISLGQVHHAIRKVFQ